MHEAMTEECYCQPKEGCRFKHCEAYVSRLDIKCFLHGVQLVKWL